MTLSSSNSASRHKQTHSSKRWCYCTILRLLAAAFAVLGSALFAAAVPTWNSTFRHNSGPQAGDWTDVMPIPILVFVFLFDILYVTTTANRRDSTNPIIPLVADLLIWTSLVVAISFATAGGLFLLWRPVARTQDGNIVCNVLNLFARECQPIFYSVGSLQLGGIIFSCLVWIIHFTTFLKSCVETHQWRAQKRRTTDARHRRFMNAYYGHHQKSHHSSSSSHRKKRRRPPPPHRLDIEQSAYHSSNYYI